MENSTISRSQRRAKKKNKQTVPSKSSLLSLARGVVKEVSDMEETRPNQNFGREVRMLSKKLKDVGMVHTMVDGKTGANRKTMAISLLESIKSSETAKLMKKRKENTGSYFRKKAAESSMPQ